MIRRVKGPFRKVVTTGVANVWRGKTTSYSGAVLECGHKVHVSASKNGHPGRVRCAECGRSEIQGTNRVAR